MVPLRYTITSSKIKHLNYEALFVAPLFVDELKNGESIQDLETELSVLENNVSDSQLVAFLTSKEGESWSLQHSKRFFSC